jgi:hypothetical protein
MNIKSGFACSFVALITVLLLSVILPEGFCGDPPWRAEFDETCANTSDAMALAPAELEVLIAKCEHLQKIIGQLDESTRKVFLKRVLMCKNLYQYVLDSKKRAPENAAQ